MKFDEKADLMHSKSMHPAMLRKVNLGVVRALKNVDRTYLLDINNIQYSVFNNIYSDFKTQKVIVKNTYWEKSYKTSIN